ncbi:phage protein [Pseudomonas aeruginosa]|uniref:phage protein n=1 Tax=Pseudomonas aeruginosa TaxID=287 RepID=UPI00053E3F8D|nr:phage protein [Pseudomonas aeruginosa]AYZ49198.1 hypothetical protein EGY29_30635 [Pseudomonas aeruginosa]KSE43943.1 hypothetical protein AO921_09985 [Pseudomonas aeruginosa]KSJ28533.1 hypothetical protein AO999_18085 [Pseudomonas aeruginosa]KSK01783.1 hypothetical protein APA30_24830 [Pseudomonas aeruginosa]KSL80013.1 hypothetical protein APA54_24570 [Pseudomonas aeruginosa]
MSAEMQLAAVPPKETALQVYSTENGLEPYLQIIKAEIDSFVPDVSTRKGREAIASIAYKVARSKTALDNAGKELVAELKEVPKKIDAERKRMRDLLDAWQADVRRPLTEWEQREEMRKAKHQAGIDQINLRLECRDLDSTELKANIEWLEGLSIGADWEEFETEAARTKDKALAALREALVARDKYEAEQAELELLRAEAAAREQKEREERIAREAAEQARRQEEAKAQAERDAAVRREAEAQAAAERRELELKLAAERAEREAIEAKQRAEQAERDAQRRAEEAAAAERKRQADEQARIEREAAAREADKAHKKAINNEALAALIAGGMPEECAKQAITLIAQRKVPHITINY